MTVVALAGLCLLVTVIAKIIERDNREIAAVVILLCSGYVVLSVLGDVKEVLALSGSLFDKAGIDESYLKIILKSLGICFVTQLAVDICRDNGENALGSQLELAGKLALLVVAMPLFSAVIAIIDALLG